MYRVNRGILSCAGSGLKNRVARMAPAAWFRPGEGVTGTLTASNWADQSGNGRDLAQGTAGNQPIYLPYTGTVYAYLPGVAGNYFSTPDSAANSIVGAITLDVFVACNDWTPSAYTSFLGKWEPAVNANESYALGINTNGTVLFSTRNSGAVLSAISSTVAPTVADAGALWIRVSVTVGGSKEVTFYTSANGADWTQLGDVVSAPDADSIIDANYPVIVGGTSGSADNLAGRVFRVRIFNSALGSGSGTAVVDFNPSTFAETSTNGTTATMSTGEVWTLNSTGAKPAQVVKSASILGDGTDDFMQAVFTLDQPITYYIVAKGITWTNGDELIEGAIAPGGAGMLQQITGSPQIRAYSGNSAATISPALGSKFIAGFVVNNTSSVVSLNSVEQTGTAGTRNMGGITLFSDYLGTGNIGNFQVYELLIFSAAHTAAERSVVRNYLAVKHSIAL